jgi:hypothetical protein
MAAYGASARAPAGLSPRARRLWSDLTVEFKLGADGEALLLVGLRALTRLEEAERIVGAEGLTVAGGNGTARAHPLLGTIKEERLAFVRIMRQLGLDDAA